MLSPRVLHVVSELFPFVKTGGLADVAAALPAALVEAGVDARVLVPGYPSVMDAVRGARVVWEDPDLFRAGPARLLETRLGSRDLRSYVLDCPGLYQRSGGPYGDEQGVDWPDNARRFAALGWAARELACSTDPEHRPDIVHAHDWQAGLAPAYVKLGPNPPGPATKCVATVHSISYPGAFDPAVLSELKLPQGSYSVNGVEFFGRVSFLKAALYYADRITTVSPSYAREIKEPHQGGGFEGLLRTRAQDLVGILNGVDYEVWSPDRDPFLPARYDARNVRGKASAKRALQKKIRLDLDARAPLFGVVSRLVWQKGIDCVVDLAPWIVSSGAELAILGSGDTNLSEAVGRLVSRFPGRVGAMQGFDEALSHLVQGGSDCMLVPSRSEPCGLTQLYALRYGSPPVVRRTGGLADTVTDATAETLRDGTATGFSFDEPSAEGLRSAMSSAIQTYRKRPAWRKVQRAGMNADFGWARSALEYRALYLSLTSGSATETVLPAVS